jgi:hypothetical protein
MIDHLERRPAADVFGIDPDIEISGDGTDDEPFGVREIELQRWLIGSDLGAAVPPGDESPGRGGQWLVAGQYGTDESTGGQIRLPVPSEAEALQPPSLLRSDQSSSGVVDVVPVELPRARAPEMNLVDR